MIKIYHVPTTRSIRVIWALEELKILYEVCPVKFDAEFRASPEWRRKNPTGKIPVLDDGDFTLFESGAMVQYLLDRYGDGRLQPIPGSEAHALYLQWSWFAESTFARPLGEIVNHRRAIPEAQQSKFAIEEMKTRAHLCLAAIDQHLQNCDYLVQDTFSGADIMMGYSMLICDLLAPTSDYKNAKTYWLKLQQRKACQIAMNA